MISNNLTETVMREGRITIEGWGYEGYLDVNIRLSALTDSSGRDFQFRIKAYADVGNVIDNYSYDETFYDCTFKADCQNCWTEEDENGAACSNWVASALTRLGDIMAMHPVGRLLTRSVRPDSSKLDIWTDEDVVHWERTFFVHEVLADLLPLIRTE